jgi:hypothetical protein
MDVVLHSDYSAEVCLSKLAEQIDSERLTIFSLSGYRGHKAVLGSVSATEFRLHKRRYWHNDFAPVLYGNVISAGRGSRIEGYWGIPKGTRRFMRVWLILATIFSAPIFLASIWGIITGHTALQGSEYIGLLVPSGLVLFGFLLPKVGAVLSAAEKPFLLAFLEQTLVATPINGAREPRAWDSAFG